MPAFFAALGTFSESVAPVFAADAVHVAITFPFAFTSVKVSAAPLVVLSDTFNVSIPEALVTSFDDVRSIVGGVTTLDAIVRGGVGGVNVVPPVAGVGCACCTAQVAVLSVGSESAGFGTNVRSPRALPRQP